MKKPPVGIAKRATTADNDLAELIIREIIAAPLAGGTPLREQSIADCHAVSRPTAREGLRQAARAGFVEITPFRGAHVVAIAPRELADLLALLKSIYGQVAFNAAERASSDGIQMVKHCLHDMESAFKNSESHRVLMRMSFQFGGLVGQVSESPFVSATMERVGSLVLWQQRLLGPDVDWFEKDSLEAHRLMCSALNLRSPELAQDAARSIINLTIHRLATLKLFDNFLIPS